MWGSNGGGNEGWIRRLISGVSFFFWERTRRRTKNILKESASNLYPSMCMSRSGEDSRNINREIVRQ